MPALVQIQNPCPRTQALGGFRSACNAHEVHTSPLLQQPPSGPPSWVAAPHSCPLSDPGGAAHCPAAPLSPARGVPALPRPCCFSGSLTHCPPGRACLAHSPHRVPGRKGHPGLHPGGRPWPPPKGSGHPPAGVRAGRGPGTEAKGQLGFLVSSRSFSPSHLR